MLISMPASESLCATISNGRLDLKISRQSALGGLPPFWGREAWQPHRPEEAWQPHHAGDRSCRAGGIGGVSIPGTSAQLTGGHSIRGTTKCVVALNTKPAPNISSGPAGYTCPSLMITSACAPTFSNGASAWIMSYFGTRTTSPTRTDPTAKTAGIR